MKKFYLLIAGAVLFIACNNEATTDTAASDSAVVKSAVALPYTASYSSSFEMGSGDYNAAILQGSWKDWETNNLDNMKTWVADTITAFQSDGVMIKGVDSLMANWKRARARYSAVIDTVEAVTSLYSTDKKENWVLVWAQEINTKTDGTKDTIELMETWRINKDGKADFLLQYERKRKK
jgi:hypothetical protein